MILLTLQPPLTGRFLNRPFESIMAAVARHEPHLNTAL
jgi:hypothetical protein